MMSRSRSQGTEVTIVTGAFSPIDCITHLPLAKVLRQQPHNQWQVFSLVVGWQQNRIFVRLFPGLRITSAARHVGISDVLNTGCLHQVRCPWKSLAPAFGSGEDISTVQKL